ncbi:hypothetical protein EI94DRAFT_1696114 [Lactarius quietus]|nr:hypothetical protein EI94DRAFT_1696114 [Lactarius quietus]
MKAKAPGTTIPCWMFCMNIKAFDSMGETASECQLQPVSLMVDEIEAAIWGADLRLCNTEVHIFDQKNDVLESQLISQQMRWKGPDFLNKGVAQWNVLAISGIQQVIDAMRRRFIKSSFPSSVKSSEPGSRDWRNGEKGASYAEDSALQTSMTVEISWVPTMMKGLKPNAC